MAEESGDPGSSSAASSQPVAQPSLSMRILVYGFRKKFPQVNHITCEETEKMQREVDKKSLLILVTINSLNKTLVSCIVASGHTC